MKFVWKSTQTSDLPGATGTLQPTGENQFKDPSNIKRVETFRVHCRTVCGKIAWYHP